jgi:N-acetylglutamate synthase-like GNAT family acetyltransferase
MKLHGGFKLIVALIIAIVANVLMNKVIWRFHMQNLEVRRFNNNDATTVSEIICRNFLEVNIKDYSKAEMECLSEIYNSDKVLEINDYAHMYVVCMDKKIVGCGAISSFWGKQDESILLTIFVLPELQGMGVGRTIIETLESDEYFLRAKRIEIPASITACEFYKRMGYDYKDKTAKLDDEGHYRLEKFR